MNTKRALVSALMMCGSISPAFASHTPFTFKECVEISSEMNQNVPVTIEKFTMLDSTYCTPGKRKPVLNYRASMSAPKTQLNSFDFASIEMRRQQINSWCTDPNQLKLLKQVDVVNRYYDSDRIYIGQIQVKLSDCAMNY